MKIAFTTCVQLGKSCIEEIYKIGGQLDLMITLKDEKAKNKSGRIYLDDLAAEHNVPRTEGGEHQSGNACVCAPEPLSQTVHDRQGKRADNGSRQPQRHRIQPEKGNKGHGKPRIEHVLSAAP